MKLVEPLRIAARNGRYYAVFPDSCKRISVKEWKIWKTAFIKKAALVRKINEMRRTGVIVPL